jgi:hypothetical protein
MCYDYFFLIFHGWTLQCKKYDFLPQQDAGVAANPYYAAILTGLIRQAGALLGVFLIARFPRKILMVFSASSMALSMFALGLIFLISQVPFNDVTIIGV